MKHEVLKKPRKSGDERQKKRKWQKLVTYLAAVVVFCTTYALILPAFTLEKEGKTLDCPLSVHQHTQDCYDGDGNLKCGQADFVVHVHNEDCMDEDGNLVCDLPEVKAHEHTEACYESQQVLVCQSEESGGHVHDPSCYTRQQGEVICENTDPTHVHTEECYNWEDVLGCGLDEGTGGHTHTSDCYAVETTLTCENQAVLHSHTESCYDAAGNLICGQLEVLEHQHENGCFKAQETDGTESGEAETELPDNTTAVAPLADTGTDGDTNNETKLVRLLEYAEKTDGAEAGISIRVKGQDEDLKPNEDGSYDVVEGDSYDVRVSFNSEIKVDQGRYYVIFPSHHDILADQSGELVLEDNSNHETNVGSWYFSTEPGQEGWMIFDINSNITQFSKITLYADVEYIFDSVQENLDFDGEIKVNVKPSNRPQNTQLSKWARRNSPQDGKVLWEAQIDAYQNSKIVGSTFTDTLTTPYVHEYREDDMRNIEITASYMDSTGVKKQHSWTIGAGTDGFNWSSESWNYTFPATVTCKDCGETFDLGENGWSYNIKYTSSTKKDGKDGFVRYENKAVFDNDEATAKVYDGGTESVAHVYKQGSYQHNNSAVEGEDFYANDTITWSIRTEIPGVTEGNKYDYYWHLWDTMELIGTETEDYDSKLQNPIMTVSINGGDPFEVKEFTNAARGEEFAWKYHYYANKGNEIVFLSHCTCTEETCQKWNSIDGKCGTREGNDFCSCWCTDKETVFTLTYETPAKELVTRYGGLDTKLHNNVDINNLQHTPDPDNEWVSYRSDTDDDEVLIPGVFTKQRTGSPNENNGFHVEYSITVNEMMADFSEQDSVTIVDTMSETLAFMQDTLVIIRTDASGEGKELNPNSDYTVAYGPSTNEAGKNVNVVTINLLGPALGPYKYTLIYDAGIYIPSGEEAKYSNEAYVVLFGEKYDKEPSIFEAPQAAITGETYEANLYKCDSKDQDKALEEATFALFSANGTKMGEFTTDEHGIATIETDTSRGISFHPHTLYYFQEIKGPFGYDWDPNEKYYFWFCNNNQLEGDSPCSQLEKFKKNLPEGAHISCIYTFRTESDKKGDIIITNEAIGDSSYELPSTGGPGTLPYTFSGIAVVAGTLTYYTYKRRKKRN